MDKHTKVCGDCGEEKSSPDFDKRAASKDGLSAKCKKCQKVYDVARRDNAKRKAQRKQNYEENKGRHTTYTRKWRERNPEKYKAHIILNNAVRDGKIIKGVCEECQSSDVEAHHEDHAKPLEVRWLCPKHHGVTRRIDGDVHESA
jgi:hypothetical protein